MAGEPQFSYLGAAPASPHLSAGYTAEPYLSAEGPPANFETFFPLATGSQASRPAPLKASRFAPSLRHSQGYGGRPHGLEAPYGPEAGVPHGHHAADASVFWGPEPPTNEPQFRHLDEPIQLEMDDASEYPPGPAPPPVAGPHSAPAEPGEEDGLWDPEWSIAIFTLGCCVPPVLLYNFLFCHSNSTTARVVARLSQMVFIFYAIIFVMVMAVVTATDSW
eukprot:EG_transcript_17325